MQTCTRKQNVHSNPRRFALFKKHVRLKIAKIHIKDRQAQEDDANASPSRVKFQKKLHTNESSRIFRSKGLQHSSMRWMHFCVHGWMRRSTACIHSTLSNRAFPALEFLPDSVLITQRRWAFAGIENIMVNLGNNVVRVYVDFSRKFSQWSLLEMRHPKWRSLLHYSLRYSNVRFFSRFDAYFSADVDFLWMNF